MRANTLPTRAIAVPRSLVATRSNRGVIIAYLRALTLTVWFGSLVLNYWWRQDWFAIIELAQSGFSFKEYYYYGFAIALVAHLTLGLQKWISAPFNAFSTLSGSLLTIYCTLMLLLSPMSVAPTTSAVYAVGTWLVFVLCSMYWKSDYSIVRNVLVFSGICLFAWLIILLIHHGFSSGFGSAIGGINRNATSTVALAAMVCCILSKRRTIRWGSVAGAMALSAIVTSRGTMLAVCVFLAAYYTLHKGTAKAIEHAFLGLVLMASVLLASAFLQEAILEDVLRIHDETRGIGSGFTGRLEKWAHGFQLIWESPLFGHGFRAASVGALGAIHSGYLKIFAESGLIGGLLIISAVFIELLRRVKLALRFRTAGPRQVPGVDPGETMQLNTVASATMSAMLVLWVYEPFYINLGSAFSVAFFLMMAAPSYVSAPPVPSRRTGAGLNVTSGSARSIGAR